jgi:hypothetical protein
VLERIGETAAKNRYITQPLRLFVASFRSSLKLLELSKYALDVVIRLPNLTAKVLSISEEMGRPSDQLVGELQGSERAIEFIAEERKSGFPFLHAHTFVATWGSLEAAIEDALVGILLNEPDMFAKDIFARVKIPVSKFDALNREERIRFVLSEVARNHINIGHGVDAFEPMLDLLELSGTVGAATRKTMWEMNHVRNVIVHRDSRADSRLVQNCPWLGLKVGDKVCIDEKTFREYTQALLTYVETVIDRLLVRYVPRHVVTRQ